MSSNLILELKDITRTYRQGTLEVPVLKGANFTLTSGTMAALIGPSGSGKSTLLQIAGLLDAPDSGTIHIQGRDVSAVSEHVRTSLRNQHIGFVFQFHHLLPEFSALENVCMPARFANMPLAQAKERAAHWLGAVGLSHRMEHRPTELSGGEQQRVAIVRALINQPALILADEPTGNLDKANSDDIFSLMLRVIRESGAAALIATHNTELARQMDVIVKMDSGKMVKMA